MKALLVLLSSNLWTLDRFSSWSKKKEEEQIVVKLLMYSVYEGNDWFIII